MNKESPSAASGGGLPHSFDAAVGPAVMARAQGVIMAAAGVLGYTGVLLPHDPSYDTVGLACIQISAVIGGAVLFALGASVPRWILRINPPLSTVLTSLAVYFSGDVTSAYALFYFWACIYAFYFFGWREAIVNVTFVCANYAAVVMLMGAPGDEVTVSGVEHHLVMTVGTLTIAGLSLIALRGRVDQLFGRLTDAARTDALTGLPNRVGFQDTVAREVERAQPEQRPLSVLVLDIDRFKRFNERYGSAAGDEVLRRVGNLLHDSTRLIDTIARTGGGEFGVVLPETEHHKAFLLAEDLLSRIRNTFAAPHPEVTASVGVATFPLHAGDLDSLVTAADGALYAAKALGRDRAVIYSPDVTSTLGAVAGKRSVESQAQLATVISLAEALDQRDSSTARHSQTVGALCELMAKELGLEQDRIERVHLAGILHDIGKIGVPDSILQKPGPLTEPERVQMRRHPELGARILSSREMDDIREWILAHHERPDGQGYPKGLTESEIPLEASILAVADAYEAMTADRVYRPSRGEEAAREELRRCAGSQFDERVVEALLEALRREGSVVIQRY